MVRVARSVVKTSRQYDASGRRQRAEVRAQAVLDAAARRFLDQGYAATTVAAIAADAGVSVETVYKRFASKAGLVAALWSRGLLGSGETPAEQRSDTASATLADPRAIIRRWTELAMEV